MKNVTASEYTPVNENGYEQIYVEYEDKYLFGFITVLRGETFVRHPETKLWWATSKGRVWRNQDGLNQLVESISEDMNMHEFPDIFGRHP